MKPSAAQNVRAQFTCSCDGLQTSAMVRLERKEENGRSNRKKKKKKKKKKRGRRRRRNKDKKIASNCRTTTDQSNLQQSNIIHQISGGKMGFTCPHAFYLQTDNMQKDHHRALT